MAIVILIAFLTLPLVEIALFILVGDILGLGMTIGLVILTTLSGAWLLRFLGFTAFQRLRESLARQEYPEVELFNAVCLFAAAVLLIVPGFFTDSLGILLFSPGLRGLLRRSIFNHFVSSGVVFVRGETSFSDAFEEGAPARRRSGGEGDIIEGEFELLTPNKNEPDPGSPSLPEDPERDNGGEEKGEAADDNGTPHSKL
jgi:UPF0716 protein FxsA